MVKGLFARQGRLTVIGIIANFPLSHTSKTLRWEFALERSGLTLAKVKSQVRKKESYVTGWAWNLLARFANAPLSTRNFVGTGFFAW
jgi:hypothetical protein